MKRTILFLLFALSISSFSYSQIFVDKDGNVHDQRQVTTRPSQSNVQKRTKTSTGSKFDISKLSIGGNFGLQFGHPTIINISPQVGYDFSKYYSLGAGLGYTYYKDDYYDGAREYDYKSSYMTFNLYGRLYPIETLVINVQPEISRMWRTVDYYDGSRSDSEFVPSLLVGGGFRYYGMIAMIQYDVLQNKNSPYGDGIVYTVGYSFNF